MSSEVETHLNTVIHHNTRGPAVLLPASELAMSCALAWVTTFFVILTAFIRISKGENTQKCLSQILTKVNSYFSEPMQRFSFKSTYFYETPLQQRRHFGRIELWDWWEEGSGRVDVFQIFKATGSLYSHGPSCIYWFTNPLTPTAKRGLMLSWAKNDRASKLSKNADEVKYRI